MTTTMRNAVDLEALARVGRALADDTRRRILVELLGGPGYPSQLAGALGTTMANVSNHLACLRGCGLVIATYEGRHVRYTLADQRLANALGELVQLVAEQPCPVDRS
jgi:DNA-binding transcriptional ArsR family regulator